MRVDRAASWVYRCRVASTRSLAVASVGGGAFGKHRRRPPVSMQERARRRAFGDEWGKFMHQAARQLQEAKRK